MQLTSRKQTGRTAAVRRWRIGGISCGHARKGQFRPTCIEAARHWRICGLAAALGLLLPVSHWNKAARAQAVESARPRASAAAQLAGTKWCATLPHGVRVELESVEKAFPDGKVRLWQPDGSGLAAGRDDPTRAPGECTIFARLTFPSRQEALRSAVTFGVQGARGFSGGFSDVTTIDGKQKDYFLTSWSQSFPSTQSTVSMVLNMAYDPRQTIISGPPGHATARHLTEREVVTLTALTPGTATSEGRLIRVNMVKLTVPSRFVKDSDYGFVYIDHAGAEHNFQHLSWNMPDTTGPQTTLRFNLRATDPPIANIKELRFVSRRMYKVVFPDVALRPNDTEQGSIR